MVTKTAAGVSAAQRESEPRKRGYRFYIRRGLVLLLVLFVGLPCAGFLYESGMAAGDAQRYPMPGQLVEVEGHNMHIYCAGEGSPTVILEAGSFTMSIHWGLVQPAISETTRVCSYDRAGYGWSESRAETRTPLQITHELHSLLQNAGIEGPYVMVGASYGGRYIRMYAIEHPQDVAGLVLVDARPEPGEMVMTPEQIERFISRNRSVNVAITKALGRFGIARLFPPLIWTATGIPADLRQQFTVFQFRDSSVETSLMEWAYGAENNALLMAESSVGDRPLIVLAAPNDDPAWGEGQQVLAGYSTNSRYILAEGSGHAIELDRPDVVITAIRRVVEAARTGEPLTREP